MILNGFRLINKSMEGFWIGFGVVSCCADDGLLTKLKKLIFRHGEIELKILEFLVGSMTK